ALIPALPLLSASLCAIYAATRVKGKLPAWTTVACLGLAFALTVALWLGDSSGVASIFKWINVSWGAGEGQQFIANFGLYIDSLTLLWMLFVTGLGALIALYASEYMSH